MKISKLFSSFYLSRIATSFFTRKFYFSFCLFSVLLAVHKLAMFTDTSIMFINDISSGLLKRDLNLSVMNTAPVLSSSVPQSFLPPATYRKPVRGIFSELFNTSCNKDVLGIPEYVKNLCSKSGRPECSSYENLTCKNLLSRKHGPDPLYKYAKNFMLLNPRKETPDEMFVTMTADCATFRRMRGFEWKSNITEDMDFSIAFNFLVHKNVEMVERLLYGLYRKQHQFCLHVDFKANNVFKMALHSIARCLPNVFVASKLENVVYAGFSRLQADINCMSDHLARGNDWKYVINAAGESYPLRSQREMIQILRMYNGTNDIEGIYANIKQQILGRYKNEFVESVKLPKRVRQTGKKNPEPPHGIKIVKGSAYGAFSRGFVEYLLTDQKALDLLSWMKKTYSPDELYWPTLHHRYVNPQLQAPGGSFNQPTKTVWKSVYANWSDRCFSKRRRSICINGVGDLPNLLHRPELFVNKFHADTEPLALECLRAWIDHKEMCPVIYNYDSYELVARLGLNKITAKL